MRKLLVVLAASTMLAGCNMAPKHIQPALASPADFADPSGVVPGVRATEVGWRDFLADPRLEALIGLALERNRDLQVSVGRIEEARGQFRITNADRFPSIGTNGSAVRQRFGTGALNPGVVGGGIPPGTELPSGFVFNQYNVNVGVSSFELDFWGRVRNLSEAARREYFATIDAARAFRLSLIRDVASAYLAAREADERIALADQTLRSRVDGTRLARRRFDAGVTSALDLRQAEALQTQAETELAAVRLLRAQSDNQLTVLIGGPAPADLPAPLPLASQTTPTIAAGLPSDLLVARPDIVAAEQRLRAARANIGAARAAFFPSISLTGSAGFASTDLGDLFSERGFTWSIGPSISLPIFDFGRTRGNLTVAEARENIAVATYERTVQGAFQEVADALAGRRFLAEQVAAGGRAVAAQQGLSRIASVRYREGVAGYLEVLDAERNRFTAESALVQLRRLEAENRVALYIALGGGEIEGGAGETTP